MKNILSKTALLIFPVIFLYFGYNFHRCTYGFDPEYAYLMNGLMINNCDYVGHTDNPGTTVQTYSAVIQRIAHLFGSENELQTDVLKNPDYFIEWGRKGFNILNSIMILLLGLIVFRFTGNLFSSLIIQITPFLSSNLLEHAWARFSPEPMLVIATNLMIIALIYYHYSKNKEYKYFPWIFGAISGFGLATKATFLPLVIIPLLVLISMPVKKTYLKAIVPSFIFFTIPAIPAYPQMLAWFFRLFTHTGVYGKGNAGLIDPGKYFSDLLLIFKNNIALTISVALALILIIFLITKKPLKVWFKENDKFRLIFALFSAQIIGILMVAKHYHSNHYLIPVLALNGLMIIFLIQLTLEHFHYIRRISFVTVFVLIVMIAGSAFNIPYMKYADWGYVISDEETFKIEKRLKTDFPEYVKTNYLDRINKYSALRWGNDYSRSKFNDALAFNYPEALFYDFGRNSFQNWHGDITLDEFLKKYGKKILLIDGPFSQEEIIRVRDKSLFLNKKYIGRIHNIYEIDTTDSKIFLNREYETKWQIVFDPDSVSTDGNFFVNGKHKIPNTWHRNSEMFFSGNNSAKLSGDNNFAFDFKIDSLQPGQEYQVTVWKKGEGDETLIVAGSIGSDEFWAGSDKVVAETFDGWKKLRLRFQVPPILSQGLKVYIWNNSEKTVYLDDFTITRLK